MDAATAEVSAAYGKAEPEARSSCCTRHGRSAAVDCGPNENAYADMTPADRDARVAYLAALFSIRPSTGVICARPLPKPVPSKTRSSSPV